MDKFKKVRIENGYYILWYNIINRRYIVVCIFNKDIASRELDPSPNIFWVGVSRELYPWHTSFFTSRVYYFLI